MIMTATTVDTVAITTAEDDARRHAQQGISWPPYARVACGPTLTQIGMQQRSHTRRPTQRSKTVSASSVATTTP
jgi:hypothetical protein